VKISINLQGQGQGQGLPNFQVDPDKDTVEALTSRIAKRAKCNPKSVRVFLGHSMVKSGQDDKILKHIQGWPADGYLGNLRFEITEKGKS
jgi:hypothetical protein